MPSSPQPSHFFSVDFTPSTIYDFNTLDITFEKELFNVCEYSLQLVLESDIEREKERKAWEAKCKLSDEWFETLDDEHKEFVRVYARHCMPQG